MTKNETPPAATFDRNLTLVTFTPIHFCTSVARRTINSEGQFIDYNVPAKDAVTAYEPKTTIRITSNTNKTNKTIPATEINSSINNP
jgi:hypothetical protein